MLRILFMQNTISVQFREGTFYHIYQKAESKNHSAQNVLKLKSAIED